MARKNKCTQDAVLKALEKASGTVYIAARTLNVTPQTLFNYAKKWPAVREMIDAQRGQAVDHAEVQLYKAARRGVAWAVCFLLKTQGKNRGYTERQEYSGPDGGPLQYADVSNEELDRRIAELEARIRGPAGRESQTPPPLEAPAGASDHGTPEPGG